MKYSDSVILVFSKAPVAGQVKTRLVPHISASEAADLHEEFTRDRLSMCAAAGLCDVQLWCSPDTSHEFFCNCRNQYGVELRPQLGESLGERMSNAISDTLRDYSKVIIIGTDAPALDIDTIDAALCKLQTRDIVLVPAEDGGYVLIGASTHHRELLDDIPWGTEHVLSCTLRNIDRLGLGYSLLPECWDVDRPEDLERYLSLGRGSLPG